MVHILPAKPPRGAVHGDAGVCTPLAPELGLRRPNAPHGCHTGHRLLPHGGRYGVTPPDNAPRSAAGVARPNLKLGTTVSNFEDHGDGGDGTGNWGIEAPKRKLRRGDRVYVRVKRKVLDDGDVCRPARSVTKTWPTESGPVG
jgi:hypothetical protein